MKKKPHQHQGELSNYFEAFRKRIVKRTNDASYEVVKLKNGYRLNIYYERAIDKSLFFESEEELYQYVNSC